MTSATAALRGPLRKRDSHLWARHAEDWYIEPEWCSTRLFEIEKFSEHVWDPACGSGRIVKAARAAGYAALGSDIISRSPEFQSFDFMTGGILPHPEYTSIRNIVSNPPFGIAEEFVSRALDLVAGKVAMLLPANWIQGDKRSRWLEATKLRRVLFITPRPSMPPGPVIEAGGNPGNGTTDYAWFIWDGAHYGPPEIGWLRRDNKRAGLLDWLDQ